MQKWASAHSKRARPVFFKAFVEGLNQSSPANLGSSEYIDILMGQRGAPPRREASRPAIQVQMGGRAIVPGAVNNLLDEILMRPAARGRTVREHILMLNRPPGDQPLFNINAEPFFPEFANLGFQLPRQR